MRVLIVTSTYPPIISGVGSLVQEMARHLVNDSEPGEHFVRVLARRDKGREGQKDPWLTEVRGGRLFFFLTAAFYYLRYAWRDRYDVVHVHESDGAGVVVAWKILGWFSKRFGGAKLVATLQVTYKHERKKVRGVWVGAKCVSRPVFKERWFAFFKARIHTWLGWLTVRLADRIVAPSYVTAGEIREDYGAGRVDVIYNGLKIEDFAAKRYPVEEEMKDGKGHPVQILYVGRLRTRKAVAVLLEAFAALPREEPSAILRIVGTGEQEPALESLAKGLGIADRVFLEGRTETRAAALEKYADADIYCLPSLYEGFPVATLEAMAAGLPVVSTTVSGIPEQVDHGETGLLVPPENASALAAALCELIENPAKRKKFGDAGRKKVEAEFTIQKIAKDYLELWKNLLDDGKANANVRT